MKNTHRIKVRALIVKDESVLLVRHEHHGRPPFWCFPGGFVESGEDLFNAIKREIREETEVVVSPRSVIALLEFKSENLLEVIFSCDYVSGKLKLGSDPDNPGIPTLVDAKWARIDELDRFKLLPVQLASLLKDGWDNLSSVELLQIKSKREVPTKDHVPGSL
ncbi:MAG: NUDIX domain-containing protein [Mesotoga sp.]|jgi:ADP-ribose pyrophosphatase YjhB (NUDIX family)|uniref:NUDIX domain-containing protein n=1 Tax=Mesotoga sp. TaxID=2053577 RepID=UPI00169FC778|nr:NUDIX domain-containing protein [Mesotoga sp.]MDD2334371.1 NUDIX domain-containing protein [Mesotoga sp.]MDD3680388.1 NUDIX domain-containing protein [Mesotoga sp.]MDI9368706.1 NUDIX domain-containing protein [Thermotogota bacterium]NLT45937.1 NUDIX domain-containing protein [Thermotogaceae bacterium]